MASGPKLWGAQRREARPPSRLVVTPGSAMGVGRGALLLALLCIIGAANAPVAAARHRRFVAAGVPPASTPQSAPTVALPQSVVINCELLNTWEDETGEVIQYQCNANNTGPTPITNLNLTCTNYLPTASWNIDEACSINATIYPGELYAFGFQTLAKVPPGFAVHQWNNPQLKSSILVLPPAKGEPRGWTLQKRRIATSQRRDRQEHPVTHFQITPFLCGQATRSTGPCSRLIHRKCMEVLLGQSRR